MIPKKGSIYDHVYIKRQFGSWNLWQNLVEKLDIDEVTKVATVSEIEKVTVLPYSAAYAL